MTAREDHAADLRRRWGQAGREERRAHVHDHGDPCDCGPAPVVPDSPDALRAERVGYGVYTGGMLLGPWHRREDAERAVSSSTYASAVLLHLLTDEQLAVVRPTVTAEQADAEAARRFSDAGLSPMVAGLLREAFLGGALWAVAHPDGQEPGEGGGGRG